MGLTQKQPPACVIAGDVCSEDLAKWPCGIHTHRPAVFEAGAAAMQRRGQNKGRPDPRGARERRSEPGPWGVTGCPCVA